ncbi:hypothetical protein QBC43DRAFT_230365 [Cladorrhinum sp. PSN259]|nr:hypothetical protein QBC43DRAFT_230365 [Cladorrhinum sp. PSN259]
MSGIGAGYSRTSHRQQQHAHTSSSSHHRARSLSLSRTTTQHHRPRRRAGAGAAAAYGNGNASGGGVAKYYAQHERLSMSSPRVTLGGAGWPVEMATPVLCRPGSQSPESRGERIKYLGGSGQGSVYNAFDSGNENGLRMGLQRLHGLDAVSGVGVNKLPNPRVPSARRSGSFETVRGGAATEVGRKTRRSSPGKRANSKFRPQYKEVRVLIITWSFHDLRAEDYTAPPAADYVSLEDETKRLKETLGSYGYKISEFDIPMDHSVEKTKAKLKEFCRYANEDTLLMVYYHGHGSMDEENELVFSSHDHPDNAEWSQAAAAELYAALFPDEACPNVNGSHGRKSKIKELKKKYERYRPVSSIRWDTIREPLLSAPCDVLFILDCCAAGGANLRHVDWQPPSGTQFTKHLFAACGFESSTSDDMTAAMCEVLDQWVHEGASTGTTVNGIVGIGGGLSQGPAPGSGVLTTKRLHQLMEDRLQKRVVGSQPIFKQLLPHDPEQYITLPNLRDREMIRERRGSRSGTSVRGYVLT